MHDLATQMPEKVAEMQALYEEWASNNKVEPWSSILKIMEQKKSKP